MTNNNTHKQTPIGLIPKDWEVKKLGDLGETIGGLTYNPDNLSDNAEGVLVLRSSNIKNGQLVFDDNVYVKVNRGDFNPVCEGDILICVRNGSKSLIGKNALITKKIEGVAFGAFMAIFRSSHNKFLYQIFDTEIYYREIHQNLGATINSINGSDLKQFKIPVPPLPEQEKIAKILSTWDKAIDNCKSIIDNLKQRKKGLAQEILLGKIRFSETQNSPLVKNKGYVIPKDWKVAPISKLVKQVKKSVSPEPDTLYSQIGIRSHAKGIFYKEAVTGLSIGNKSVFEIEPDCFIVNIVFAWEHAIAKTTINEAGMIASHRFPMYKPLENELDLDYLLHFFKSKKGKELLGIASPGGAGRNKTLGQSEFLKLQIPVPTLTEQKKIAEFLDKIDTEIVVHQQKLAHLQNQKKGLMQQLLTGKTRVKLND